MPIAGDDSSGNENWPHAADIRSIRQITSEFTTPRLGAVRGPEPYWGVQSQDSIKSTPEPYVTPGFHEISSNVNGSPIWYSPLVYKESKNHGMGEFDNRNTATFLHQLKQRLSRSPGIKMIAHGTKCNPRPVWITLHFDVNESTPQNHDASATTAIPLEYQLCLTWRAEIKRPSKSLDSSSLKLGNLRRVAFHDILGIERGKRTTALRRIQTAKLVNENECFSLLTKSGTLDLQCSSDFGDAAEVREGFIELLGIAMRSNELTSKDGQWSVVTGFSGGVGQVNVEKQSNGNVIYRSSVNDGGGGLENSFVSSAPPPLNRKSSHVASVSEHSKSSQQSGPILRVPADVNLSVISF